MHGKVSYVYRIVFIFYVMYIFTELIIVATWSKA
jgi:hypothetical protein